MSVDVAGPERYNTEKLAELEKHIDNQVVDRTYQLDANLALLRLYQYQPSRINLNKLLRLLVKALMQLPSRDFQTCLYLVPDHVQAEEAVANLVMLARHLESCRFKDFWAAVEIQRELLNSVPGFYDAVRSYSVQVLTTTFQRISKTTLSELLKLDGMGLDTLVSAKCKSAGWSIAPETSGSVIILPKTEENHPKAKQSKDTKHIGLNQVMKMAAI
uniref:Eukaryotic translation initiation factor 3 subunit K n=1 Tax=Tetraselmis sp. GSL018 TaxID=582737 RepID=A0A061S947_9CHLO|eukprot:CAMPEP_0177599018 /NCGR_PEP_ID=MMETSP0419_2-20121207/12734_1 /TAXON_ID=582737 /ORGANISM="Tetraselmis sp., Strain GSL018" /LENGTH=215 /DNA_ID=CAMNT_0019091653 /DNA_START=126 /DNA_END=773 /DNA_ORIENTATION=-